MPRYFLEVSYKGDNYSGFQVQENANTIQGEVEKALAVLQKQQIILTGSSRTDAGVHALQNYFHFDIEEDIQVDLPYHINAILPPGIAVRKLILVKPGSHARFDAIGRSYQYHIYQHKDPFLAGRAYFFPYSLNIEAMQSAAEVIKEYNDFTSFSKRNTQVKTFLCRIESSTWAVSDQGVITYNVTGDRFLRGMVRALTATMLKVGRNKLTLEAFRQVIDAKDCTMASFAVPAHGLFLTSVKYPVGYFNPG
jgi:tRNA pseudouridine38-40 synthase